MARRRAVLVVEYDRDMPVPVEMWEITVVDATPSRWHVRLEVQEDEPL